MAEEKVRRRPLEEGNQNVTGGDTPTEVVSTYLHHYEDRIESPLTGELLHRDDPLFPAVDRQPGSRMPDHGPRLSAADFQRLLTGGFLIEDAIATSHRSRLLYASIETCTTCNHRCAFCPVSVDPRSREVMPQEFFERIVDEVIEAGVPGVSVFLNNYNEPTVDPLFLDRLRVLFGKEVPTAILTNASHLPPEKIETIRGMGRLRYLGVNLPTTDPARYREMHGTTDLPRILANIDYAIAHPLAEENAFVVLGYGDERHDFDLTEIERRYAASGWTAKKFVVQSRAGLVDTSHLLPYVERLGGCEQTGSRPLQHLHVVTSGRAIFCCQDYYERYPVGDLRRQSVREVLASPELARLRRWAYGVEDAPDDFICRRCEFALERKQAPPKS
jgi:MoaA/NifB/PqqE/SkfB family radical SAM enzyme